MTTKKKLGRTQGMSTPLETTNRNFIPRLQELAERHSYLGIAADLASLTLIELWGVYRLLSRIEGGAL